MSQISSLRGRRRDVYVNCPRRTIDISRYKMRAGWLLIIFIKLTSSSQVSLSATCRYQAVKAHVLYRLSCTPSNSPLKKVVSWYARTEHLLMLRLKDQKDMTDRSGAANAYHDTVAYKTRCTVIDTVTWSQYHEQQRGRKRDVFCIQDAHLNTRRDTCQVRRNRVVTCVV